MTKEEAKANQERIIASGFDISWWYASQCRKCCDVYPKIIAEDNLAMKVYLECEVCGRRTHAHKMPWLAKKEWDEHFDDLEIPVEQISLFDFMEKS